MNKFLTAAGTILMGVAILVTSALIYNAIERKRKAMADRKAADAAAAAAAEAREGMRVAA